MLLLVLPIYLLSAIPQNMEKFKSCIAMHKMVLNIRGDEFMEKRSMTALVSAFSRAYHSLYDTDKVFDDYLAKHI
jgi:O-methyltransferase involved in polyketide biosynthesis